VIRTAQLSARSRLRNQQAFVQRLTGMRSLNGFRLERTHLEDTGHYGILKVYYALYAIDTWRLNLDAGKVLKPVHSFEVWRMKRHRNSSISAEGHRGGRSKQT
jgi:hypothetical protein